MERDYLRQLQEPNQSVNPLFNFLGIRVELITAEKVVLRLPLRADFLQGAGVIAGGILATLADEAMAHLVIANLEEKESTATVEMNLRFFRPLTEGELVAEATLVKKGRQVMTLTCSLLSSSGQLVAQAGATFMILRPQLAP